MTYDSEVLADTPRLYYKTDQTSGTLTDSSGNSINLSQPGGAPTYAQTGPSGSADALSWPDSSGGTEYYASTATLSSAGTTPFTLECWFKLTATPTNPTPLVGLAFGYGNNSRRPIELYVGTDGKIKALSSVASGTNPTILSSSSAVTLNVWHHVTAMFSNGVVRKIRLDKTDVASDAPAISFTTSPIFFVHGGGTDAGSVVDLTNGSAVLISKPALYQSVLSDARSDAHFDAMPLNATVTVPVATATASAAVPVVAASSTVSPPAAGSTASAPAPTVSAATDASVVVPVATSTASAMAPAVAADFAAVVPAATASADALAPTIAATGNATVVVPVATATAGALPPTVSAGAVVDAPAATASAAGVAPTVAASSSATVVVPVASAAAAAVAPFVFNGSPNATVEVPVATATAEALAPSIGVGLTSDVSNVFNGRARSGFATVTATVPVAATPAGSTRGTRVDKAVPLPLPTLVNGRPT